MRYVQKTFLEGTFMCTPKFSCVRSSYKLCARTHVHSLEGTLLTRQLFEMPLK